MPLDAAADAALVRETFRMLRPELEGDPDEFYRVLFAAAPEMRAMFRDDMGGQGMRFLGALGLIVESLEHPAVFEREVDGLGRGHAALGVGAAEHEAMLSAVVAVLRRRLGDRFGAEAEAAWRRVYADVARRMMAA